MTRFTTPDALPSPDDYQQPADTPAAITALADATQAALIAHDTTNVVNAGDGLVGGGAVGSAPVLAVGAGAGITVEPDAISLDTVFVDGLYSRGDHVHPTYAVGDHVHAGVYSPAAHDHSALYAPIAHGHDYAAPAHGHLPSQVGIRMGQVNLGTINAGAEKSSAEIGKAADEYVIIQSAHPSTWIATSLDNIDADSFQIKARNSTAGTNHTNVVVYYMLVRGA